MKQTHDKVRRYTQATKIRRHSCENTAAARMRHTTKGTTPTITSSTTSQKLHQNLKKTLLIKEALNRYTTYYNHYTKGAIIGTKFRYYIGFLSYGVSETVRMKANHFKSVLTNPNLSLYISAKHDITSLPKKLASLLRNFLLNKLLFSF